MEIMGTDTINWVGVIAWVYAGFYSHDTENLCRAKVTVFRNQIFILDLA
jgi:hypothetical protein